MAATAPRAREASAPHAPRRAATRLRRRSALRDRLEYAVVRAGAALLAALPLSAAVRVGAASALVAYALDRRHRRIGMRNLAIAFPEKPLAERRRILRASFANLGRIAAELAHLPALDADALRAMVRFADEDQWARVFAEDRPTGYLCLSGHFGNWELLVFAQGMRGRPVSLVYRPIANPLLDRWLETLRRRAGTVPVRKHEAARGVLRAIRERRMLVMPFDQNSVRGLGVFVDFFGLPASTTAGLARVALRSGVPVLPVFIVREGTSARHVAHILPSMLAERTDDLEEDVRRNTERFSRVFEEMVRRHPEQWLWVHRRWKTRPPGERRFY
jgi:KDO2-lipid IV(A) lauroyltransferase